MDYKLLMLMTFEVTTLPAHMILDIVSLLLSAAAVDREEKKVR